MTLTREQMLFYKENGYLLVKDGVRQCTLQIARKILERWIDDQIGQWYEQGLLQQTFAEVAFERRLIDAWHTAGRPVYSRSPRRDLVSPYTFEFLKASELVDIAADLLNTPEVSVHGIFNARPKLPDQKWTDTPWHQDAQYYQDAEKHHVVSMWIPLQTVTEHNSCLQVAPNGIRDHLLPGHNDEESGFLGLSKADAQHLEGISIGMEPGDVLCFTHLMPHRALPNQSDAVRWSMDVRFESTDQATDSGKQHGFIARSPRDPGRETSYADWLKQWANIPKGSY